jgi:ABC-type lipoprotein export system ATPase subunit
VTGAALVVHGLTFGYPGSAVTLFNAFDITAHAGEMVAVQGPSGCGKSTLLYLLGLLIQPGAGRIVLGGQDTTDLGDHERSRIRAHYIGFVFQDAALQPNATVEENVAEGALYAGSSYAAAAQRARDLLDSTGIADIAGRRPTQISGGQAQRVALCRALIRSPLLILADEPTGNLDPDNAAAVIGGLRAAAESGAAVVVVTHSPVVAGACDRVIGLA